MNSPFKDALGQQLLDAARRDLARGQRGRRRVRGFVAAVAAAVAAAAITVWTVLAPSPAAAEVEIRFDGDRVFIELTNPSTTPGELRRAIDDAGLAAEVEGVPVGPSSVGRFLSVAFENGASAVVEATGEQGRSFTGFSLARSWPGSIIIYVGVPADDDELYGASSDAFAPGEPLHCSGLIGQRLDETVDRFGDLDVVVQDVTAPAAPLPLTDVVDGPLGGYVIEGAEALSASLVVVSVTPAPTGPFEDPSC